MADILDPAPKGDVASMEHPLFALKAGDRSVRTYEHNGWTVTVKSTQDGCATIHDKDLWIFCISQLVEARNRGREISRVVRFVAHDFFRATCRDTSGQAYKRLSGTLARLSGTRIETNIETGGLRERRFFGLIDAARVIESEADRRMVAVEVTLPVWLFRSIETMKVLTLSRDYFQLRKPLDRRVYELARKHCGSQRQWRVSLDVLHLKSGCGSRVSNFRVKVRALVASGGLPDYAMAYDQARDIVTFRPVGVAGKIACAHGNPAGHSRVPLFPHEKSGASTKRRRRNRG